MFLMFEALKWNLNPKSQIYNCTVLQNLGKPTKKKHCASFGGQQILVCEPQKKFLGC